MKKRILHIALIVIVLVPAMALSSRQRERYVETDKVPERAETSESSIVGGMGKTAPAEAGRLTIRRVGDFDFKPRHITTLRPDIFKGGYFSIFDILAHLDARGDIELEYHFDEKMNTHVIDSLNGKPGWWYRVHYHGGWGENNVFRMDHFPYKDRMDIVIENAQKGYLSEIHSIFREEVRRRKSNGGRIIIPEVFIRGPTTSIALKKVEVRPHNLRSDAFQNGVVTAIDVIMTLADEGALTFEIRWHEHIGSAIVQNYLVDRIDEDAAYGRCGFVYESGSRQFDGFRGNHIHLPPDTRVINSPEYLSFFWICI
jgi:hypothetical protein